MGHYFEGYNTQDQKSTQHDNLRSPSTTVTAKCKIYTCVHAMCSFSSKLKVYSLTFSRDVEILSSREFQAKCERVRRVLDFHPAKIAGSACLRSRYFVQCFHLILYRLKMWGYTLCSVKGPFCPVGFRDIRYLPKAV